MNEHWRLAFMLNAPGGDLDALEASLAGAGDAIRRAAGDAHVRTGVADRHPDLAPLESRGEVKYRTVDGAVEITVDTARAGELPAVTSALRDIIGKLAAPGSVEVMAGPIFHMVPVSDGETFLSLAFRRDPATSKAQFADWWLNQHAPLCIPILTPQMLAYDQVHVDQAVTDAVSAAFGAPTVTYDAYDNLTWADRQGFLGSIGDADAMARIFQDELGRIDETSRRNNLMRKVGQSG